MISPIPFPNPNEGFKYLADMTTKDMSIVASKNLINLFFRWKQMKVDAKGAKYNFEEHVETLAKALTVLEMERILTIEQKDAIIKHLSDMEDG